MLKTLRQLARDERGNSVVELAIILPVFATLLMGAVDLAQGIGVKLTLVQASQRSIEKVMQTSFETSAVATIKAEAAAVAGVDASAVTVDYWLQCNGVRQNTGGLDAAYNGVCPSGQNYARYLSVEVTKNFTPQFITGFRIAGMNADGSFTLKGKAGIRTQ